MTFYARTSVLLSFTSALALVFSMSAYADIDVDAAKSLAKKNSCFKCHAVDKEKEGPAYKKVAEKYRGQADAEEKLVIHVTTGKRVKFPDGHEDEHQIVKTKNMDEIKNLVDWILSL
jgi:cytochrome c